MGRDGIHRAPTNRLAPVLFYIVSPVDYAILLNIMDEDKRGYARFLFSEPVAVSHPNLAINGSVAGNISLSGISLRVHDFVPMGTVLEMQIRLDGSPKVIWAKAKVVRIREVSPEESYEIGLNFIRNEECSRAIGGYIMAHRFEPTKRS